MYCRNTFSPHFPEPGSNLKHLTAYWTFNSYLGAMYCRDARSPHFPEDSPDLKHVTIYWKCYSILVSCSEEMYGAPM